MDAKTRRRLIRTLVNSRNQIQAAANNLGDIIGDDAWDMSEYAELTRMIDETYDMVGRYDNAIEGTKNV